MRCKTLHPEVSLLASKRSCDVSDAAHYQVKWLIQGPSLKLKVSILYLVLVRFKTNCKSLQETLHGQRIKHLVSEKMLIYAIFVVA